MICRICGEEFEPKRSDQKTCGDIDCKAIWKMENCRRYMQEHRAERRAYNRDKMREYRAEYGYAYGQKKYQRYKPKKDTIIAEGYEDRQIQKTLEMVGKVEL